ncbi:hypothetical protein B0I35DRAFT_423837 [Stachybotrys elegans]|uniref:C2H2-type domain-containing protein n=1 Tax=Stachybotrys elegans TaxID=80388 RepID=A0A8K0SWQ5_9HYPO|nr:hypothetical protein B0I35DRAFT_423837 [Stachybotrys elegans]
MSVSASERCYECVAILKAIVTAASNAENPTSRIKRQHVQDELERFCLWAGNIGAFHAAHSPLSLESRLNEAEDVFVHIMELLEDLEEVASELSDIVAGRREGEVASEVFGDSDEEAEELSEETELLAEIGSCIGRLFRISGLIRQAGSQDVFAKALSRSRYRFDDRYDINHVQEKYPKLAGKEWEWLRTRLGRSITHRRHYLSYIHDHREKLQGKFEMIQEKLPEAFSPPPLSSPTLSPEILYHESKSQPSTFFTEASKLNPAGITQEMLAADDASDHESDAKSYTTITRSVDEGFEASLAFKIPRLDDLQKGSKKEIECPFCYRMKKFKNERVWRRHVYSDLRSYVCTFPGCDAPYFSDINDWFRHEMQVHRVSYTCQFCQGKSFKTQEAYLSHIRKQHPDTAEGSDEQPFLDIARRPMGQIPAQDCPCCTDWEERLRERNAVSAESADVICVLPTMFKRHLGSHMEQLALFAIPISSANDTVEADSNKAAVDEDTEEQSRGSVTSSKEFSLPEEPTEQTRLDGSDDGGSDLGQQHLAAGPPIQDSQIDIIPEYDESKGDVPENTSHPAASIFKNSVYNMAHFGNPDFQPEEWHPDDESADSRVQDNDDIQKETHNTHPEQIILEMALGEMELDMDVLERLVKETTITEEMMIAAMGNERNALKIAQALIAKRDPGTHLSEEILEAASRNHNFWLSLLILLVPHTIYLREEMNLALVYRDQSQWEKDDKLFNRIVELCKDALGLQSRLTLMSMDALATIHTHQSRWEAVKSLRAQIFDTMVGMAPLDGMDVLDSQYLLAEACAANGDIEEAIKHLEHVYYTIQSMDGKNVALLSKTERSLGKLYRISNRPEKAVEILENSTDNADLQTPVSRDCQRQLALAYLSCGRLTKGATLLSRLATEIVQKDGSSWQRLVINKELAGAYEAAGMLQEAGAITTETRELENEIIADKSPDRPLSYLELAQRYQEGGLHKDAVDLLERAVATESLTMEADDQRLLKVEHYLARAYQKAGHIDQGIALLEKTQVKLAKILPEEDPRRLKLGYDITRAYMDKGQLDRAIEQLSWVVEVDQRILAADNPRRKASEDLLESLVEKRKLQKEEEKAAGKE